MKQLLTKLKIYIYIPLKVYTNEGVLSDDLKVVLTKWQSDYYTLYNSCYMTDNNFMLYVSDVLYNYDICTIDYENVFLNEPITMEEVQYAIQKLKSGKAVGIDRICKLQGNNPLVYNKEIGNALKLIKSYFSNRTQRVQIDNDLSDFANIICGVPQGSVLGPFF